MKIDKICSFILIFNLFLFSIRSNKRFFNFFMEVTKFYTFLWKRSYISLKNNEMTFRYGIVKY